MILEAKEMCAKEKWRLRGGQGGGQFYGSYSEPVNDLRSHCDAEQLTNTLLFAVPLLRSDQPHGLV